MIFNILVVAGNILTRFNSVLLQHIDEELEDYSQGQDGDELVSFENLFQPGNFTHDNMRKHLYSLPISTDCLVQARTYPASDLVAPMSSLMDYIENTLFTPSEIMLHRLATKCNQTEAEFQEVIGLFKTDEVGLDLSRKLS